MFFLPHIHLVLIGLRGSGKSTVGRALAERLGCGFVDLDSLTPAELGERDVASAFANRGEAKFREAEAACLARVLREETGHEEPWKIAGQVVALGGGTLTAPGAAELLSTARAQERAMIVYLRGSAATLRARLSQAENAHRPSLTGKGMLEEIDELLARRDPLYRRLADVVIELDRSGGSATVDDVAAEVLAALRVE